MNFKTFLSPLAAFVVMCTVGIFISPKSDVSLFGYLWRGLLIVGVGAFVLFVAGGFRLELSD